MSRSLSSVAHPGARGARKLLGSKWLPYVLIAPAVIFELLVHVVPMIAGIWVSFTKMTQMYIRDWVHAPVIGGTNYAVTFDFNGTVGIGLLKSFGITCGFTVLVVGISWAFGMAAAVALQKTFKTRSLFRTLFLIPYALPAYAAIISWKFIFQRDNGALNSILVDGFHLSSDRPFWLIGDNAFWSLVIVGVWRLWPFAFMMLMAGMQSIPNEYYEAASVDGARAWRQWRAITLPSLHSINSVLILVTFLWTFNDFNTPFVLFGANAQPPAGDLISFHIYNSSFLSWNFGQGAAMSVMLLLFLLAVSLVYLRIIGREGKNA